MILGKALAIVNRNPHHYFYIDAHLHQNIANLVRSRLRGVKNWEFKRQSDDYIEYLKFRASVEKHIVLLQTFNKFRTSGNLLELIALNRHVITICDNNWTNNFLLTIQYPNATFFKKLLDVNLATVPPLQPYEMHDWFMEEFSINAIDKKLTVRREIKLNREMITIADKKNHPLFCCMDLNYLENNHQKIKESIEKKQYDYYFLPSRFLHHHKQFESTSNVYFLERMNSPLFRETDYPITSYPLLIRFAIFMGYKEITVVKSDIDKKDEKGIRHIEHDIKTYFRDIKLNII